MILHYRTGERPADSASEGMFSAESRAPPSELGGGVSCALSCPCSAESSRSTERARRGRFPLSRPPVVQNHPLHRASSAGAENYIKYRSCSSRGRRGGARGRQPRSNTWLCSWLVGVAARLHRARCSSAFCAATTFSSSPRQISRAGCCMARANEKVSAQGSRDLNRTFIAFNRAEASSGDCPPDKNATAGTAAGTARKRHPHRGVGRLFHRPYPAWHRTNPEAPCWASRSCPPARRRWA